MDAPQPREHLSDERCMACWAAISKGDGAVYLYGAWFHYRCYERENGVPTLRIGLPSSDNFRVPDTVLTRALKRWYQRVIQDQPRNDGRASAPKRSPRKRAKARRKKLRRA